MLGLTNWRKRLWKRLTYEIKQIIVRNPMETIGAQTSEKPNRSTQLKYTGTVTHRPLAVRMYKHRVHPMPRKRAFRQKLPEPPTELDRGEFHEYGNPIIWPKTTRYAERSG